MRLRSVGRPASSPGKLGFSVSESGRRRTQDLALYALPLATCLRTESTGSISSVCPRMFVACRKLVSTSLGSSKPPTI